MILKQCKYVITQSTRGTLTNVDIRVEGNKIAEIGRELKGGEALPCNDKIIIPGFLNSHVHADTCFVNSGITESEFISEYPYSLIELERNARKDLSLLSAEVLLEESLLRGCTSLILFTKYHRDIQELASKARVRVISGPLIYSINELRRASSQGIENAYCAYFSKLLRESTLVELKEFFQDIKANRVYIHVSETRKTVFEAKKKFKRFPIELLDELGLLTEKTVLTHSGWVTSWEIEAIRRNKSSVVYCPSVEMKLATGGFPPIKDLTSKGVCVGLGTDSLLTGLSLDVIEEARVAVLHQRESYKGLTMFPKDALNLITSSAEKLTGLKIGKIKEGYLADLLLIKFSPKFHEALGHGLIPNIVYRLEHNDIDSIMVGGELIELSEYRNAIRDSIDAKLNKLSDLLLNEE